MSILKRSALGVLLIGALSTVGTGCDDDPFRDAPRAEATRSAGSTGGQEPGSVPQGAAPGVGPVSGMELPPGHPPIGEAGAGQPAPAGFDAASVGRSGPIRWTAPAAWEAQPPANEMRYAQYSVSGGAEVVVFYFGPDGAGGIEANLQRWSEQFTGGPQAEIGQTEHNGVQIHTFDGRGSYDAGMAMGGGQALEDHRMLGAIAETEVGPFFFRLLGPAAAVEAQEEGFQGFVESFEHGDS